MAKLFCGCCSKRDEDMGIQIDPKLLERSDSAAASLTRSKSKAKASPENPDAPHDMPKRGEAVQKAQRPPQLSRRSHTMASIDVGAARDAPGVIAPKRRSGGVSSLTKLQLDRVAVGDGKNPDFSASKAFFRSQSNPGGPANALLRAKSLESPPPEAPVAAAEDSRSSSNVSVSLGATYIPATLVDAVKDYRGSKAPGQAKTKPVAVAVGPACPECGHPNEASAVFCRKCRVTLIGRMIESAATDKDAAGDDAGAQTAAQDPQQGGSAVRVGRVSPTGNTAVRFALPSGAGGEPALVSGGHRRLGSSGRSKSILGIGPRAELLSDAAGRHSRRTHSGLPRHLSPPKDKGPKLTMSSSFSSMGLTMGNRSGSFGSGELVVTKNADESARARTSPPTVRKKEEVRFAVGGVRETKHAVRSMTAKKGMPATKSLSSLSSALAKSALDATNGHVNAGLERDHPLRVSSEARPGGGGKPAVARLSSMSSAGLDLAGMNVTDSTGLMRLRQQEAVMKRKEKDHQKMALPRSIGDSSGRAPPLKRSTTHAAISLLKSTSTVPTLGTDGGDRHHKHKHKGSRKLSALKRQATSGDDLEGLNVLKIPTDGPAELK